jgi:hypothetical protein
MQKQAAANPISNTPDFIPSTERRLGAFWAAFVPSSFSIVLGQLASNEFP